MLPPIFRKAQAPYNRQISLIHIYKKRRFDVCRHIDAGTEHSLEI